MPSSVNYRIELSLQLLLRKRIGKWTKRLVVLRRPLDISQKPEKWYLDVQRKTLKKFSTAFSEEIEISPHSHVVVKDIAEDSNRHLLGLVPVSKERHPCYLFSSHDNNDLNNLADAIEEVCQVKSFEVSIDSDKCNQVPTGAATLHIWQHNACLTSKPPLMKVLQKWQLVDSLQEMKWERHLIQIHDSQTPHEHLFDMYPKQCDVKNIQKELLDNCKMDRSSSSSSPPPPIAIRFPLTPFDETGQSGNNVNHCFDIKQRSRSIPCSPVRTYFPVKERVEIRFPGHEKARRCQSDTSIRYKEQETHTNQSIDTSRPTMREINDIAPIDKSPLYANMKLRPTFYIYTNVALSQEESRETPNAYINIFSGSSFKGCYENWEHQRSIYSTIPQISDAPPLPPRPLPPKLPPRRNAISNHTSGPQRPPPIPPRPKSPVTSDCKIAKIRRAPRIQVAVFGSPAVVGRVWFLRVAFMHQDDNNSTFKRVTDIESSSNHKSIKSQCLDVSSDLSVTATSSMPGFDLLNDNQQEIELSDINNLRKGDWFIIEFHIQNSNETKDHFVGNVFIGPKSMPSCCRNCKAEMGIDEVFQRKVISQTMPHPVQQSLLQDYNRRQRLCRSLDITINPQCHDWRQVAGSLGFTYHEILDLQDKACRSVTFSPTNELLNIWEQREPNCTMEKLVNILREIGRLDVVQDLGYNITLES